ncbi:MAG: hypothetical protein COA93_08815 [Alphaproteobacteria bacterium]|nr:MAG: hypothetical protein COA93_08815 [Alphaproteobacteria bacterium]
MRLGAIIIGGGHILLTNSPKTNMAVSVWHMALKQEPMNFMVLLEITKWMVIMARQVRNHGQNDAHQYC